MLYKTNKRKTEGFTIIEVMIVLAIAGLILLIVFLAVPALQRSSRNTQRKNDVSAILGAVSDFSSNNAGTEPNKIIPGTGTATNTVTIEQTGAGATANTETATVGYYAPGSVTVVALPSGGINKDTETVDIVTGATCNSTNTSATAGTARTAVALFALENGSSAPTTQCQEQ